MKNLFPPVHPDAGPVTPAAPSVVVHTPKLPRPHTPVLPPRRVFAGSRKFLRALRAAEMAMWNATGGDFYRSPSAN